MTGFSQRLVKPESYDSTKLTILRVDRLSAKTDQESKFCSLQRKCLGETNPSVNFIFFKKLLSDYLFALIVWMLSVLLRKISPYMGVTSPIVQ